MIQMLEITETPIDTDAVLNSVSDESSGASVLFVGTTRRWTVRPGDSQSHAGEQPQTLETSHLIYEAYRPMAEAKLRELAVEACRRWPICKVSIVHRAGRVDPRDPSVAIAVSTPHRREAFEAGQWLIDTVKHEVPIWKQEHYVQNGPEWIHPTPGSCNCDHVPFEVASAQSDLAQTNVSGEISPESLPERRSHS
ncbi:MAG: molybdenum cofactor biosynthesis protein MoaE [Planctomycetaceae bacterium]|jgi:molybdopterin synthase catalytic subunit|nr:molybdenum cofactor biosynthesis protein MoaE [Planctomycetaceae bacterium]